VLDIFHHHILHWIHWKEAMSVPRLENTDQFHMMNPAELVLIYFLMTESEAAYENMC
jgi:hypothetical protein